MDLEILRIASDTSNNKNLDPYTHFSESKNPICGDVIQIKLIAKGSKVSDFAYQGKSCVYCQATASLLAKTSKNRSFKKINELCNDAKSFFNNENKIFNEKWSSFNKLFNKKNLSRKECILLPFKTLQKIVSQ
tara:strand:- start:786 stop:1184 length:399 start_codon:yes stop_codon:yes gene_type:complete